MTDGAPALSVLIADDHAMFRSGLRAVIDSQSDLVCVGEASNGQDAVDHVVRLRPDVAVLDIRMPKLDGIGAMRAIAEARCPTHVLILTTYDDEQALQQALSIGASGFLLKTLPPEELVAAIKIAARGDAFLDPSLIRKLAPKFAESLAPKPTSPEVAHLTQRELEVLLLVADARSNAEIAEALFIGEQTVKTHVSRVLAKLGLRDRVQAVVYAYQHRLVPRQG